MLGSGLRASEIAALQVAYCLLGYGQASLVVRRGKGSETRDFITQELKPHLKAFLDLSEGGARLEHAGRFALGAICFLRLPAPEGELLLKARIVHSAVSRTVPGSGEGTTLLYQSGVEFVGLTSDALLGLRQFLAGLGEPPPPT